MRKVITLLVGALILVAISSCKKVEYGIYNPEKKIQKTYLCISPNVEKYLYQKWCWDGGLLRSIEYYTNLGQKCDTDFFVYDGERLTLAFTSYSHTEFTYDGNYLKEIKKYDNKGNLDESMEFYYTDKKFSKIIFSEYSAKKNTKSERTMLDMFLPLQPEIAEIVCKFINEKTNQRDDDFYSFPILLNWDGNNINELKIMGTEAGANEDAIIKIQYDNKKNPLKDLFYLKDIYYSNANDLDIHLYSENNIIFVAWITSQYTYTHNYSYKYDSDGYPTEQTIDSKTTYFEYE